MQYWYDNNGQQDGPYTLSELIEKKISDKTLVFRTGETEWKPKSSFSEIQNVINPYQPGKTLPISQVIQKEPEPINQPISSNPDVIPKQKNNLFLIAGIMAIITSIVVIILGFAVADVHSSYSRSFDDYLTGTKPSIQIPFIELGIAALLLAIGIFFLLKYKKS